MGAMIPEHLLQLLGLTGAFQWRLSVLVRYCHAEAEVANSLRFVSNFVISPRFQWLTEESFILTVQQCSRLLICGCAAAQGMFFP